MTFKTNIFFNYVKNIVFLCMPVRAHSAAHKKGGTRPILNPVR